MPYNFNNLIDQGVGTIFGIAMGGYNDQRQYDQQARLQELQIKGQKEMQDYSMAKQYQMWLDTNYDAQVRELNKAGLNPGLLYGMKGGGGVTTGSPHGNVTGGQAPAGGREIQDAIGMGIQMRLLQAQEQNIRADTELKKADATKTAGVDTQLAAQTIEQIFQGTENLKQQHTIQKLDITLKNIENFEKQATQEDRMDYIDYQSKIAMKQLGIIANDKDISDATKNNAIQLTTIRLIGAQLQNIQTGAQTAATVQSIRESEKKITMWYQDNMRQWDQMSLQQREIRVKELLQDWTTDPNRELVQQTLSLLGGAAYLMKPGQQHNEYIDTKTIVIPKKN